MTIILEQNSLSLMISNSYIYFNLLMIQQFQFAFNLMNNLPEMFQAFSKHSNYGIEGYFVQNKYFDARRSKQQHSNSSAKMHIEPSKKITYIDQILKRQAKSPGPSSYNPKSLLNIEKPAPPPLSPPSNRKTIFDELQDYEKKKHVPAAGTYDKIQTELQKGIKLTGNMNKAELITYLQNSMRSSLDCPGVGSYNTRNQAFKHNPCEKWKDKNKAHKSTTTVKCPDIGSYNPLPVDYNVFDKIYKPSGKQKPYFSRQQRFKSSKHKPAPYYNVGSEWGMKNKLQKKDILSKISSSVTHHSVYH